MKQKNIPMRVVKEKTGLTSRQIRYYDQMKLIFPDRTKGNQRLFSEGDIERLLRIKDLLEKGYTLDVIKEKIKPPVPVKKNLDKYNFPVTDIAEKGELSSLYPVSNLPYLTKILEKKTKKK